MSKKRMKAVDDPSYELVIESGVPCPPVNYRRARAKYPFDKMEVSQSFVDLSPNRRVLIAAVNYGKRNGMKFKSRKLTPAEVAKYGRAGVRVWRDG